MTLPRRRKTAWPHFLGVGVLAAAGSVVLWMGLQTEPSATAAPSPASTFGVDDPDTFSGESAAEITTDGARVIIPSLDVQLPWRETTMGDGILEIPDAPTAGWYDQSAAPGADEGTTILAAHVDYPNRDLTPFGNLAQAEKGAPIFVVDEDGDVHRYKVVALDEYDQKELPAKLFTREGDPKLVLVTCSGDPIAEPAREGAQWGYENNLVLTAVPDEAAEPKAEAQR